jgi:hypothetical protein
MDPDTWLRRRANAQALTDAGFPTAAATLATLATRGGGPPFRKYGRYPIYRWGDSLAWAESRLGPPVRSTAELDAVRRLPSAEIATDIAQHPDGAEKAG